MFAQIIFKHGRPVFGYSAGILFNWSWSSKLTGLLICYFMLPGTRQCHHVIEWSRGEVFFHQIDSLLDGNLGTCPLCKHGLDVQ